jgi:hypothetical protein
MLSLKSNLIFLSFCCILMSFYNLFSNAQKYSYLNIDYLQNISDTKNISEYFKLSKDLQFADNFTKKAQFINNFYLRGEKNDEYTVMSDNLGLTFFSSFEIMRNKKILYPGKDYIIDVKNTEYALSNIQTDKNSTFSSSDGNEVAAACIKTLGLPSYDMKSINLKNREIKKLENYKNFLIVLYRERQNLNNYVIFKIFDLYTLDNQNRNISNFNSDIFYNLTSPIFVMKNEKIENTWTLKQNDNLFFSNDFKSKLARIIFAVTTPTYLFLVCLEENKLNLCYKIDYNKILYGESSSRTIKISKVGLWNNFLVISSISNGLNILKYNEDDQSFSSFKIISNFMSKGDISRNLEIASFIINSKTIYLLALNYGMRIFSLIDMTLLQFDFYNPQLITFDNQLNLNEAPDSSFDVIKGILLKNSFKNNNSSEFLLEININKQTSPIITRVLSSNKKIKSTQFFSDNRFFYIFDDFEKYLLISKKSITPLSSVLIYKINLDSYLKGKSYKIFASNFNDNLKIIFIENNPFTDLKSVFVIENLKFGESTLKCKFYKSGNYLMKLNYYDGESNVKIFNQNTKYKPLSTNNKNYIFLNNLYLDINDSNVYKDAILGLVLAIFGIFIFLGICWLCKRRKTKEEFREEENLPNQVEVIATQQEKNHNEMVQTNFQKVEKI